MYYRWKTDKWAWAVWLQWKHCSKKSVHLGGKRSTFISPFPLSFFPYFFSQFYHFSFLSFSRLPSNCFLFSPSFFLGSLSIQLPSCERRYHSISLVVRRDKNKLYCFVFLISFPWNATITPGSCYFISLHTNFLFSIMSSEVLLHSSQIWNKLYDFLIK